MSQEDFQAAQAINDEITAINSLLSTPVTPFGFTQNFPSTASIRTLAQPALDTANAGWAATMAARKTALQTQFDNLGNGDEG